MKKFLFILVISLLFVGCQDEVKFNSPALQALKNNVVWRGLSPKATKMANGNLQVYALSSTNETLLVTLNSLEIKKYTLGENASFSVVFTDKKLGLGGIFTETTDTRGGDFEITDYNTEKQTISGTFKFDVLATAAGDEENPLVSFREGIFYEIPVLQEVVKK